MSNAYYWWVDGAETPLSVARRRLSIMSDNTLIEGFDSVNLKDEKDDRVLLSC